MIGIPRVIAAATATVMVAAVLVACSVGQVRRSDAPAPRQRVEAYLSALESGDVTAAYESLCDARRRHESIAQFRSRVTSTAAAAGGRPESHTLTKSDELSNGLAVVTYTERTTNKSVHRTVTLDHDGSGWCVSSIH